MDLILGVDPGVSGALALYSPSTREVIDLIDVPTHTVPVNGRKKAVIDLYGVASWVDAYRPRIRFAVIEDVHSMPKQGVTSSFSFGFCAGVLQGVIAANIVPMHLVRPAVWKRAMGLSAEKDVSRRTASRLLPKESFRWLRAKDDGRAEAVLLAIYGETTCANLFN